MRNFLKQIKIKEYKKIVTTKDIGGIIKANKESPTLYKIQGYNFPIVSGLINNRDLFATALGIDKNQIIPFITDKLHNLKAYNKIDNASFLENKIPIELYSNLEKVLPLIDFYAGKKYTTSSIVVVKYPEERRQNLSFHRMMYLGGNRFSIRIVPQRHLDKVYIDAMKKKEDLNVAVIFGVHPAIEISASFSAPKLDELQLASAFLGELNVYELPNGIFVPSEAEFVIEGRITKEMAEEGPFIDLTGTADIVRLQPILEVDTVYYRNNPIFRTILPGGFEHQMLMGIPQEPRIFNIILNTVSTVKNVVLTPGGCHWFHAVVQISKRTEGDPNNVILAALAAHPSLKRVIVVDEDIDINNAEDIEWAVATRVQPDKDIIMIPNAKGSSLDPSSEDDLTCKWGIDATKPLANETEYNRVKF